MLAPAAEHALTVSGNDRDVAISSDGRRIVYVGANGTALFVQDLDKREPVRIDVGGLPHNPTLSPDGQWIAFLDGLSALRRVPVSGGRVQTIGRNALPGSTTRGATTTRLSSRALARSGACPLKAASRRSS